jgi:hypothetical protein
MMTICQECEQFEKRVKKWNGTHGVIDPLPYLNDMVKPHKHLIFEWSRQDGAGGYLLSFQCLRCDRWWKVSAWGLVGTLNIWPQPPMCHASR